MNFLLLFTAAEMAEVLAKSNLPVIFVLGKCNCASQKMIAHRNKSPTVCKGPKVFRYFETRVPNASA